MDMEYVSLHGCIRDISPDAEDIAENQLGTVRSSDYRKGRYNSTQNSVRRRKEGKRRGRESKNGGRGVGVGKRASSLVRITPFSQKHSASTDSWLAWGSRGKKNLALRT